MKHAKTIFIIAVLFLASLPLASNAQPLSNCRIAASNWNVVSLGFPLRAERLANKLNPKILVLPYQLKGEPQYIFTDQDEEIFEQVASNINQLSNGKSKINFIFNQTIQLSSTAEQLNTIKQNVNQTYQKDFDNSTYGFAAKALNEVDKSIDFTGIDAVVLFGSSVVKNQSIAEAMMFTKDSTFLANSKKNSGGNWFDPIKTDEGEISNITLIYNAFASYLLTHEIMHLYGLTDLYGSRSSPPLSLMSSDRAILLLAYEQWILGWLSDSNVTCVNPKRDLSQNPIDNRFVLDYSKGNQSLIIPTGTSSALVIDVINARTSSYLLFYALENDARPPITNFPQVNSPQQRLNITQYAGVSAVLNSPEYSVLLSDNDGSRVVINLIPSAKIDSEETSQLIKQAELKKLEIEALIKDKAAAELKAKQDAEAAAELKAKQDAEAAAELKAKQDAEAKVTAAKKMKTIACIKGKLAKKVTSFKPICPGGYKKK